MGETRADHRVKKDIEKEIIHSAKKYLMRTGLFSIYNILSLALGKELYFEQ
jgi:hypothetical protein